MGMTFLILSFFILLHPILHGSSQILYWMIEGGSREDPKTEEEQEEDNPDPYIRGSYRSPLLELGAWVIF